MALDQQDVNGNERSSAPEEAGLPRDLYALLAQANLLRMRGCWEDAVQTCMTALRLSPESHSAQSLLGDIYENQGRYDDAIQWYRMALDINPRSPADTMKLDRLLRLQDKPIPSSDASRLMVMPGSSGLVSRTVVSVRSPWNVETMLRYAALAAACLTLLVIAFAYFAAHRHSALATLGLQTGQEVKLSPVVVSSASSTPMAASVGGIHDAAEQTLMDSLNASQQLTAQGITVYDIEVDPRSGSLALTFGVSPGSGSVSREAILRDALHVVQASSNAPGGQSASAWTARCLLVSPGPANESGTVLVFVGDISRGALPAASAADAGDDPSQMQGLFSNSWWAPQIGG